MLGCFCLRSIKIFTLKIKLNFEVTFDAFWKKLLCNRMQVCICIVMSGTNFFHSLFRNFDQKEIKNWGLSSKKIGNGVIAQKSMTSFKQIASHEMAFFKIKSTCAKDFLKSIT
jgi:hypothetical protein